MVPLTRDDSIEDFRSSEALYFFYPGDLDPKIKYNHGIHECVTRLSLDISLLFPPNYVTFIIRSYNITMYKYTTAMVYFFCV